MPPPLTQRSPAFISRSTDLDTDYRVYLAAPDSATEPGPWPALLLVDGDYVIDAAVDAYRELRARRVVPPLVLAAVGYGEPFGSPRNRRGRDYTPDAAPEEPSSGGADAFLTHLTTVLWPEIARRHPLRSDARGIGGHSLGGLFALHALFQLRPFFTHGLIGAPSLWWADRRFLSRVARLRDREEALPVRLFLGAGDAETSSMKSDLAALTDLLAARPFAGLRATIAEFPGRDHYDVMPDLFRAGLRNLFGAP
jgi:predicted alpha/beta superfamily hydrolase